MGEKEIIIFVLVVMVFFSLQAMALEAGGEYEFLITGLWNEGSFESEVYETLDLELFLPDIRGNEVNYAFRIDNPMQDLLVEGEATYFTKKLYLRHRFE